MTEHEATESEFARQDTEETFDRLVDEAERQDN
jgi:hypothetical protein